MNPPSLLNCGVNLPRAGRLALLITIGTIGAGVVGCAPIHIPLNAQVVALGSRPLPLTASLVLPNSVRSARFQQKSPCSSGDTLEASLGPALEKGATQALFQLVDTLDVVLQKDDAVNNYDLIIELDTPNLKVDGNCLSQGATMWLGIYALMMSNTVQATATLESRVSDREGRLLLANARYTSDQFTRTFGAYESSTPHITAVMSEAFTDALQKMGRSIGSSQELRLYARKVGEKREDRAQGERTILVRTSDVDDPPKSQAALTKNKHAVVIGIEQYREQLPKADYASQDAKIVGKYLRTAMGYAEENVVVLVDTRATKTDIEKYLENWLPNRIEKDDSIFIYFSGHGAPNPKTGEAYLVPYDGDPNYLGATGYSLKRLYEQLAKLPAKQIAVVLDSCFSGAGGRSVLAKGMRPVAISVENPIFATGNMAVLTAGSGAQISSTYSQKGHGLLTYFFLKGLHGEADQNQDGNIDLSELHAYLKPRVEGVSRREYNNEQTPQLLGSPEILSQGVLLLGERAR
jgi:hypothetical protein